jgi:hypothetical protein
MKKLINKLVIIIFIKNLVGLTQNAKSNNTTEREKSGDKCDFVDRFSNPIQYELDNSIENEGKQSHPEFKRSAFIQGSEVSHFRDTREVLFNKIKESKWNIIKSQYRSNSNFK